MLFFLSLLFWYLSLFLWYLNSVLYYLYRLYFFWNDLFLIRKKINSLRNKKIKWFETFSLEKEAERHAWGNLNLPNLSDI